jgi:hypothetical protein
MRLAGFLLLGATASLAPVPAAPIDPLVSLWYRGRPAGVPQADDVAAIRAAGFAAVTWPLGSTIGLPDLTRLANDAGLTVVVRASGAPLTPTTALQPGERADLLTTSLPAAEIAPLAWRALGHGARVLSIDAGQVEGTGLADRAGRPAPWLAPVAALATQFRVNGALIAQWRLMPPLSFEGRQPAALDVVLLEAIKSWVLVATNTSRLRVRATVHLPHDVPYAIWLNLLNGATMSMLAETTGPKWNIDLEAWGTRVYVIDKMLK